MSRTYKDTPWKFRASEQEWDLRYETIKYIKVVKNLYTGETSERSGFYCCQKPGVLTKKRRTKDYEYHWMSTPGWWIRLKMNRPQRRAGKLWERRVIFENDLEETDPPSVSRKPHIYYW